MTAMFEAGLTTGREQGLDKAMDLIMSEAETLSGDELKAALNLHRRLMDVRFPRRRITETAALECES
jgi:hypothetical protein